MSKSVFLPTVSLPVIILFICLALPFNSSAEQIEDIPETDLQVGRGKPAASTVQEPVAQTPAIITPSANQEPEKTAAEKPAAENVELRHISADKAAVEKMSSEKIDQDRPAVEKGEQKPIASEKTATENIAIDKVNPAETNPPVTAQKSENASSSSAWQSFLAWFGLHDDRPSIPPLEVKNTASHLGQDYIIGPGDLLSISVWRDDSLTRSVVVLPDGKIQFPLIGEILAGGKSVAQLKEVFVEKLSRYVVDADISVEVKQSNSLFIYIIGRVNGPGRQMLIADTTVLQALAMAGGLNPFAEKDDIKIFRQDRDRTLVYSFRYSQVVTGNYLDDNLLLKRGDVIVVP
jgi:polysaccharide export outer membrane protein